MRDKPLAATPARRALTDLVEAAGTLPPLSEINVQHKSTGPHVAPQSIQGSILEEINLLEGLTSGPLPIALNYN